MDIAAARFPAHLNFSKAVITLLITASLLLIASAATGAVLADGRPANTIAQSPATAGNYTQLRSRALVWSGNTALITDRTDGYTTDLPHTLTTQSVVVIGKTENRGTPPAELQAGCTLPHRTTIEPRPVTYKSSLLNVAINGVELQDTQLFLQRPCGDLLVSILAMRNWRVKVTDTPNVLIDSIHWMSLDTFAGLSYEIDAETQRINMTIAADKFTAIELDFAPEYRPTAQSAAGGFLNYGIAAATSSTADDIQYAGNLELGAFGSAGVLTSNWALSLIDGESDAIRIATTFTRDYPLATRQLRIGDINARPGAWGLGYRLGGIQFGSNFSTQPGAQFSPVESLILLADNPTPLQISNQQVGPGTNPETNTGVYFNSLRPLPYGPLQVTNLPTFGNGVYSVKGVDINGNEIGSSNAYYYNRGLLRQGLHSYSAEIGLIRQGGFSDQYATPVITATDRYGVNRALTVEGRVEYGDDVIAYGLNAAAAIPWAGVLNATWAQGQPTHGSSSSRSFQSLGLSNRFRRFSYDLNYRRFDRHFIHPGEAKDKVNNQRHNYTAGISTRLPWRDSISFGYDASSNRNQRFRDAATLSYRLSSLNIASATLLYRQNLHQTDDWLALASISLNFRELTRGLGIGSNRRSTRSQLFSPDNSTFSSSISQQSDGDLTGSYRLSTAASRDLRSYSLGFRGPLFEDGSYGVNGNFSNQYFNSNANIIFNDGQQTYSAGLNGGMALIGDSLFLTRPLFNAFALVDLGEDASGVRVNGVRSGSDGRVLVPNLQPYFDNQIAVSLRDLPLNAQVANLSTTVRPRFRSGVLIRKEIPYLTDMLVQVVLDDSANTPLPYAATAKLNENSELLPIGDDGLIYVVDVIENSQLQVRYKDKSCRIELPFPENLQTDEIPEYGPLVCEGVTP